MMRAAMRFAVSLLLVLSAVSAQAEYRVVHEAASDRVLIFVHGLWGDPNSTFAAGAGHPSWFEIIKSDATSIRKQPPISSFSIALLAFPAGRTDRLSVPQVARNLGRDLRNAGILESGKGIYFVAHSLGGLVVKEMLLNALSNSDLLPLAIQTRAVFFISTPTKGADAADFIANKLPIFAAGKIVADVKTITDNSFLQSLQERWEDYMRSAAKQRPSVYCAYETKATMGLIVVPQQYSESFCDESAEAMNEDHISIVKPASAQAQVHQWLRGSLANMDVKATPRPMAIHPNIDVKPLPTSRKREFGGRDLVDPKFLPADPLEDESRHGVLTGNGESPRPLIRQ